MRCGGRSAAVTGGCVLHAFHMFEYRFDSPEAAARKYRNPIGVRAGVFVDDGRGDRRCCRSIAAGGKQNQTRDQESFAHDWEMYHRNGYSPPREEGIMPARTIRLVFIRQI